MKTTDSIPKSKKETGMPEKIRRAELLAPAGNIEICKAVINAGADAVYLGGEMFGARAYAGNLNGSEIIEAIDYARLRGAKIYLTVNTLLKEKEMPRLLPFIKPFYEAGLDAVIVQDFGALKRIREAFPGLPVHASTQMSVMNSKAVSYLQSFGVKRVVLPREMTLEEIKEISDDTGAELEVFVHGALCYSYSGQCLFSSSKGNRSGNRGTCAQPCRLQYSTQKGTKRILSPRDIAALSLLPDILDAGAYSLKIEGRMKNVYYAAGVTAIYRKYLDLCLENKYTKVSDDDMRDLLDLYNRGSFSKGMFTGDKGSRLMSMERAKHRGTKALRVEKNRSGHITFTALEDIHGGDVIEIDADNSFTCGAEVGEGKSFEMDLSRRFDLPPGRELYRMNNGALQRHIDESFVKIQRKAPVDMKMVLKKGSEAHLTLKHKPTGTQTEVSGETVQGAASRPMEPEDIKKRLKKLGDTPFEAGRVDVISDPDIFVSVGGLNALRRLGAESLEKKVTNFYKREPVLFDNHEKNDIITGCLSEFKGYTALAFSNEQLEKLTKSEKIKGIYVSFHLISDKGFAQQKVSEIKEAGKEAFLALPYFYRQRHQDTFESFLQMSDLSLWDGILVRNLTQLQTVGSCHKDLGLQVRIDSTVPVYNREASRFVRAYVEKAGFEVDCMTLPEELSFEEMKALYEEMPAELVCYGKTVLMQSEHCVKKNLGICDKQTGVSEFDGYAAYSFCDYCNSIILDNRPLDLLDRTVDIKEHGPSYLRLDLTTENACETEEVLRAVEGIKSGIKGYTGRFTSGVI